VKPCQQGTGSQKEKHGNCQKTFSHVNMTLLLILLWDFLRRLRSQRRTGIMAPALCASNSTHFRSSSVDVSLSAASMGMLICYKMSYWTLNDYKCWKTRWGREDGGRTNVYSWWYRVKKRYIERKNGGGEEAANVSTHTNSGWRAPSWLHNMKCQQ